VQALYGPESNGWYESATRGQIAPDGTATVIGGPKRQINALTWPMVSQDRCLIGYERTSNTSYERFWLDHLHGDAAWVSSIARVRWYPDADTDGTYVTYTAVRAVETSLMRSVRENWGGFYAVEMPRLVVVS
jgi:hypothetical protein